MPVDILDYPFMRAALLMGGVLGILYALIGVFVVTRGMAFFSDFIAHAGILGGALAALLGIESTVVLIPFSIVLALVVSWVSRRTPLARDTVLGVFYGGTVALGVIIISARGLGQQAVMRLLFGDLLMIRNSDIWLTLSVGAVFAFFVFRNLKQLIKTSYVPEMAEAEGVRVGYYDTALAVLMAVTIALSIKLVGVLLANAMIVIPAAAAKAMSNNFRRFLILAPSIGVASFAIGTASSFYMDIPTGPSVIAVAFFIFLATLPLKYLKR